MFISLFIRDRHGAIGWGTALQVRKSGFKSRSCHNYLLTQFFRQQYGPEISKSNISWRVKADCTYGWRTTHLQVAILLEPPLPVQSCKVIAFLLYIHLLTYKSFKLSYPYSGHDGIWRSGGTVPVILNLDIWIWVISVTPKPLKLFIYLWNC
jgi:hypothetical protein